jgi:hypothetical protein
MAPSSALGHGSQRAGAGASPGCAQSAGARVADGRAHDRLRGSQRAGSASRSGNRAGRDVGGPLRGPELPEPERRRSRDHAVQPDGDGAGLESDRRLRRTVLARPRPVRRRGRLHHGARPRAHRPAAGRGHRDRRVDLGCDRCAHGHPAPAAPRRLLLGRNARGPDRGTVMDGQLEVCRSHDGRLPPAGRDPGLSHAVLHGRHAARGHHGDRGAPGPEPLRACA